MRLPRWLTLIVGLALPLATATPEPVDAVTAAIAKRDYEGAALALKMAIAAANDSNDSASALTAMRRLAGVYRLQGKFSDAEGILTSALPLALKGPDLMSETGAAVLSELGLVQRALGKREAALSTLNDCVLMRRRVGSKPIDTVRDLSALARTQMEAELTDIALKNYQLALEVWDEQMPHDSLEIVNVIDSIANIYRDQSEYAKAEPLLRRSLAMREAAFGTGSSELIAAVDSLAYVLFGEKQYEEAEILYRRLLQLWRNTADPEHPMVALTLEKMVEFYAAQNRYSDAEPLMEEAVRLRAMAHLRSLHQNGRMLITVPKFEPAADLYKRAIRIGDESRMSDEVMDPLLRTYAGVLKMSGRPQEAAALKKRIDAALERQPKRPSPVKLPASK